MAMATMPTMTRQKRRRRKRKSRKYEKEENNRRFLEEEKRLLLLGGRGQSRRDETMRIIEIFQNENSSSSISSLEVLGWCSTRLQEACTYSHRSLSWTPHANVRASHLAVVVVVDRTFQCDKENLKGPGCTTQPPSPSPPRRGEEKLFTAVENRENSSASARVGSDEKNGEATAFTTRCQNRASVEITKKNSKRVTVGK